MSNYGIYAVRRFRAFVLSFGVLTHIAPLDDMLAIFLLQFVQDLLQPAFFFRVEIPQAQLP